MTISQAARRAGVCRTQHARSVRAKSGMNKTTDPTKLTKLHELTLLPREIRGQSHCHAAHLRCSAWRTRINEARRPRGSFLLLGQRAWETGNGGRDDEGFRRGQLFRFDMSEFQNQEALGGLLGALVGEVGYLGGVRERARRKVRCCSTKRKSTSARAGHPAATAGRRADHCGDRTDAGLQRILYLAHVKHRLGRIDEPSAPE